MYDQIIIIQWEKIEIAKNSIFQFLMRPVVTNFNIKIKLICMYESENEVAQSSPTLCDPMNSKPTSLLHLWDFPAKNTGVGCHFLLGDLPNLGIEPRSPTL